MRGPRLGRLATVLGSGALSALICGTVVSGAVLGAFLAPAAIAAPAAAVTQCESLPAPASSSPSPSASASASASATATTAAAQLCVSVQVSQATTTAGNTASWTIVVSALGGAVPGVIVALSTGTAGLDPTFTGSCPNGSGTNTCMLGDLATNVSPASYQLQGQVVIPAGTAAGTLNFTAAADSASGGMTLYPAVEQAVAITAPSASPSPSPTGTHATTAAAAAAKTSPAQPSTTSPAAAQTVTVPPVTYTEPVLGALPAVAPGGSATVTTPAGSIAEVLPTIVPQVAPAEGSTAAAANIQEIPTPATDTARASSFTLTIGMTSQTAEILGAIIFALAAVLFVTRKTAAHLAHPRTSAPSRSVKPSPRPSPGKSWHSRIPGLGFSGIHVPKLRPTGSGRHIITPPPSPPSADAEV